MHWFQGPQHWLDNHKISRDRRHEPFTPRVPAFLLAHPALAGALMAIGGILGNWLISTRLMDWPDWMLFPSLLMAATSLIIMVIGLGLLTVRLLEPALSLMDLNWDAEPLAQLGIPLALQRKCESLGFWTAEEIVRAVDKGTFPWTMLEYDERMQIQRGVDRWKASVSAEKRAKQSRSWRNRRPSRRVSAKQDRRDA